MNQLAIKQNIGNGVLTLSPITINEDYRQKWNIHHLTDFVHLTINGNLVNNTLYRLGGLGHKEDLKNDYFMLLKHVEAFYKDNITKVKKDKPHLESRWCILNKNGVEKVEFDSFKSPYLVKNSCIYSIDNNYFNIENGLLYCKSYDAMTSADYLFLNNVYDDDKSKRGIMKINKKDGTWELFR